jgi:hypothetical protein
MIMPFLSWQFVLLQSKVDGDTPMKGRKYMRRDLFMVKLNPEKFSQRLQDLNRYLDFIPIEKTSDNNKITKADGKSLPEDEIRSIMGQEIPPE